ncbi:MAG: NACHT domain-containing NTPase [Scytonema hyalinum WJT4-NPBG1]|jgi:predicted NACHT family NTPase|nr:NACHT domain-containing NTPase [Scytonema hyalinum WJT4-NPBG1]
MTGRSLCCSIEGIEKARKALIRFSLTQKALAQELEVTRQPIGKFFTGKPVDRNLFVQICDRLELEWEEVIAEPPSEPEVEANQDNNIDIDVLVKEVREKIKPLIQERCDTMRVLEMTQPMGLNDIYTSVNILEKITGRRRKDIAELLQECRSEDFDRLGLGRITQERVPGLEAVNKHPKLMILGKPGAGKTTFLKYLAIQCIDGVFQAERVPIFVTLKDFTEAPKKPGLLEYISQLFSSCGVMATQVADLFNHGRVLVLLDGLDEVREEDSSRVRNQIREVSDNLYLAEEFTRDSQQYFEDFKIDLEKYQSTHKMPSLDIILKWLCDNFPKNFYTNYFVITCRLAAWEYTFEKFTEVEVADFDDEQIATFATKWYKDKAVKPKSFLKRLEDNNRIKQLAASPLLLTLLCLAFEESGDFPANRSELYKEGLDALLKKWDAKRGIQRDLVYKKLSAQRKEDLLSKIALTTFKGGDYFFKQKVAEQYITEYIRNLPDANTDLEALQLDSERVLKSIEAQHGLLVERAKGIYSFSHLTFHEYFTAREIVVGKLSSDEALQNLVYHITEKRWREVFLLAVGMSPSADRLLQLMKEKVDAIVATDEKLQQLLMAVNQKSRSVKLSYKPATIRAFYLCHHLDRTRALFLARTLEGVTDIHTALDHDYRLCSAVIDILDCALEHIFTLKRIVANSPFFGYDLDLVFEVNLDIVHECAFELDRALARGFDPKQKQSLQQLKDELPDPKKDREKFKEWWQAHSHIWTEQLNSIMIEHRNLYHGWLSKQRLFREQQEELLMQYYDANKLLVDCLNSDCYVSREVRQKIEDELLLPIAEINKRQQQIL